MKIFLSESQYLRLFEAATLGDIHAKYYNDIDDNTFNAIVASDPTYDPNKPNKMGKYGKWLLGLYKIKRLKTEDLYKAKQYLSVYVKYINRVSVKDINQLRSLQDLYSVIKEFIDDPNQAASHNDEIRKIKEGAEKVYEDNEWVIIIPHTKEASCYYGKGTQWCTAAEKSMNYFDKYNKEGNLFININKRTQEKYQFHFETESFMDATDTEIESPINATIDLTSGAIDFYIDYVGYEMASLLLRTKYEIYYCEDGNVIYMTSDPNEEYYYLYDDFDGEKLCDKMEFQIPETITASFELNKFALVKNVYGYKTLITIDSEGNPSKFSDDISNCERITDTVNVLFITYNDKRMVLWDVDNGYVIYRINFDDVIYYKVIEGYDTVAIKKKNKLFDLVNVSTDSYIQDVMLKDDIIETDDDDFSLYAYTSDGIKIKIDLFDMEVKENDDDDDDDIY